LVAVAESGLDEQGKWTPAFPGQRPPFELRHGAYATVRLGPRVAELADEIRELVPSYGPSDEPALRLLCLCLARLERAEEALETAKPEDFGRLRQDALGWANAARRLLNDLAMTPTARGRLGLDLTRAKGAALDAHLLERYSDRRVISEVSTANDAEGGS
jgi:hypothetical protein